MATSKIFTQNVSSHSLLSSETQHSSALPVSTGTQAKVPVLHVRIGGVLNVMETKEKFALFPRSLQERSPLMEPPSRLKLPQVPSSSKRKTGLRVWTVGLDFRLTSSLTESLNVPTVRPPLTQVNAIDALKLGLLRQLMCVKLVWLPEDHLLDQAQVSVTPVCRTVKLDSSLTQFAYHVRTTVPVAS